MSVKANLRLQVNGEAVTCPAPMSLAALVEQQGLEPTQVATAVNAQFIPRSARAEHLLAEGDQVTLFQAIVGG